MSSKSYCNPAEPRPAIKLLALFSLGLLSSVFFAPRARAGNPSAPSWMQAAAKAPLPAYDEKTDAVLLYSETSVSVISTDKFITQIRAAYKILRPGGRERGTVSVYVGPDARIRSLHGWCIPAQGRDYEVAEKDAVEVSPNVDGAELISDAKYKLLRIPASDPGNIVGYEYEVEERPFFLQDTWHFQEIDPVREAHYSLLLPAGWEYRAAWMNHAEVQPVQSAGHFSQWVVNDVSGIRREPEMPPRDGVTGAMVVTFFPPGGALNGFATWNDMGRWYASLLNGRLDPSPALQQEVVTLTASKTSTLQKMQALAAFAQSDIRYVAIELGIGGWQPHPAPEVFAHRYGDCKDKATLLRTMLKEIGIDSYHVVIYTERGAVTPQTPAHHGFNHAILAIKLPDGLNDPSVIATIQHPKLGRLLFFDPTNELIPFGQLPGYLQANYGLLVTPDGGELVELPQQPSQMNSIRRTAKLTLDPTGALVGEVQEVRLGERASAERWRLRNVNKDADRIKPIEDLLGSSMASFRITHASVINQKQTNLPFGFKYSFESPNYAKNAGNLMLVRPRVLGIKGSGVLETKEPRRFPIEFEEPAQDTDSFEITIPSGYVVDDIPPPVDADYGFASYHSKTEVKGNVVDYTRTFEVKELSVPVARADELRKFYRIIAGDERSTVVLKPAP